MRYFLFTLLLSLASLSLAQMEDVERQVTGYGNDYQSALNQALIQAVQQVRGTAIATDKQLNIAIDTVIGVAGGSQSYRLNEEQTVFADSQGWIKSYQVTQVQKPSGENDSWQVSATVVVPTFKSMVDDADKRYTLAVMPFRVSQTEFKVLDRTISARQASQSLQEYVQQQLHSSGRFALVNRQYGDEFASEKALLSSDNVSPATASRIGQVAGADLMLVGRIQNFEHPPQARREFYGAKINQGLIRLEVAYQIIEVASQRIVWTDVARVDARLIDRDDTIDVMYTKAAERIASDALASTYPIKILDIVSTERIYLTQGGHLIKPGQRFNAHGPGRQVEDPDTGLKRQLTGATVGTLEIIESHNDYSVAKWINGNSNQLDGNTVLSPVAKDNADAKPPRRETPGSSEAPLQW